jgi:DNA-binding NarL/FixJ family response regulator
VRAILGPPRLSTQGEQVPELHFLIADDHNVLRRGVRSLVENYPNWTVVAEACNGREAIEKAKVLKPDVAILDFSMPEINGLDAARDILHNLPDTKVLILTVHENDELIEEMRRIGVHAYVLKSAPDRDLVYAIKAVLKNQTFYPKETAPSVHRPRKTKGGKPKPRLSSRQKEIVKLLAQGRNSRKIAEMLGISQKTVETHRRNVMLRTSCRSTADLVRYAIRNGIIEA